LLSHGALSPLTRHPSSNAFNSVTCAVAAGSGKAGRPTDLPPTQGLADRALTSGAGSKRLQTHHSNCRSLPSCLASSMWLPARTALAETILLLDMPPSTSSLSDPWRPVAVGRRVAATSFRVDLQSYGPASDSKGRHKARPKTRSGRRTRLGDRDRYRSP